MTGTDKSPSEISDFKENHTDTTVAFTVTATKEKIDEFEQGKDGLMGKFKLSTTISTNNMTLFDVDGKIHKYSTSVDILRLFFNHRLEFYIKRKDLLLEKMRKELKILENKARFVEEVCKGELVVSNRKRKELLAELSERRYDLYPKDEKKTESEEEVGDDNLVEESASDAELAKGFEYLLGMKIWSLTFERAEELRRQRAEKTGEVETLEGTSPESIWLTDLDAIDEALDERDADIAAELQKEVRAQSKSKARTVQKATVAAKHAKKAKKKANEWDSDLESESDDDFVAKAAPKPKPVPKAAPVVKAPSPVVTKPLAPKEDVRSVLEKLSISDVKPAPVAKEAAPSMKAAPINKAASQKKAPTQKKEKMAVPKKTYDSDSDDFMEDSDSEVEIVTAPRARSGRAAAQKVTYVIDDSDSDESYDEDSD